jgi:hypothetical protein
MKSLPLLVSLFLATSSALAYNEFAPAARTGPAAFTQTDTAIAAHNSDYLAAWTTEAPSPLGTSVWCALVHPDGTLAADTATPLDPGNSTACGVSLSEGRDGYFAAWYSAGQLSAAVIDSFGRVERRTRLPFPQSNWAFTHTAWNGAVHIVVTQTSSTLTATLFDDNGEQIGGPTDIGSPQAHIDVIADASGFLVLSSHPQGSTDAIYGRRISSSGVAGEWFLIRTVASPIDGLAATMDGARDVIAWGDQFGVWVMELNGASAQLSAKRATVTDVIAVNGRLWIAYQEDPTPKYLTIGADQSVTGPITLPLTGPARLAANGTTVLAAANRNADLDMYGTLLTPAAAAAPFLISRSKADQANGYVARDLLVWDEQVGDKRQIFIGGFDVAGHQLSSDGDINTNPVAAFNGTDYLVVWSSQRGLRDVEVMARRVSGSGEIIDSADIDIGPGAIYALPRVASDGVDWLVASIRDRAEQGVCFLSGGLRVTLNRVTTDGVVLDGDGVVMPAPEGMSHREVALGWTGTRYLAAWLNECTAFHAAKTTSIRAAFVARDLSTVDDFVAVPFISSIDGRAYSTPRVAAGESSLIAWQFASSAGVSTQYRIVGGPLPSRRRAFGTNATLTGSDGALVDAVRNPNGTLSIFTQADIPWAAGYRGLFETVVTPNGSKTVPIFHFVVDAGQQLTGNVDISTRRVIETMLNPILDPAAGARRLWWAPLAGAR